MPIDIDIIRSHGNGRNGSFRARSRKCNEPAHFFKRKQPELRKGLERTIEERPCWVFWASTLSTLWRLFTSERHSRGAGETSAEHQSSTWTERASVLCVSFRGTVPVPSEAPTPAIRSRSSSPVAVSALDTSMKALNRRSEKPPRRLSNAPRWKKIAHDNVGHSLLSRMGWKEGMGLGAQEWKWQQLKREKVKRQRSNAVRALLLRQAASSQDTSTQAAATLQSAESSTDGLPVHETVEPPSESDWLQWLVQENSNAALQDSSGMQTFFPFSMTLKIPQLS